MKKRTFLIIVLIVVAVSVLSVIAYYRFFAVTKKEVKNLAQLIPDTPILYIKGSSWDAIGQKAKGKLIFQRLSKTKSFEFLRDALKESISKMEKSIGIPINYDTFKALLGKEVHLALYLPEGEKDEDIPNLLLVTRVSPKVRIADWFQKLYPESSCSEKTFEKITYTVCPTDEMDLFYVLFQDILVFTNNENIIKKVIHFDRNIGKKLKNFATSSPYLYMTKKYRIDAPLLLYMDYGRLNKLAPEFNKQLAPKSLSALNKFSFTNIYKNLFMEITFKEGISIKGNLSIKKDIDKELKELLCPPPIKINTSKWFPKDVLYFSAGYTDLEKFYNFFVKYIDKILNGKMSEAMANLRKKGPMVDLKRDFIDQIKGETAIGIMKGGKIGPWPIPSITLLFEVKDKEKTLSLLHKVTNWGYTKKVSPIIFGLPPGKEDYLNTKIYYLGGPLLNPAYAVKDRFLMISSSRDTIKQLINTTEKKKDSIAKFLENTNIIPKDDFIKEPSSLTFLNMSSMVDLSKEWFAMIPEAKLSRKDKDKAEEIFSLLKLFPFVKGEGCYKDNNAYFSVFIAYKEQPSESKAL